MNIAIASTLFIAFGDGITGIIRNFTRKKREKDWWGSLGMLLVNLLIGYVYCGWIGIVGAIASVFLEAPEIFLSKGKKFKPTIDDNIIVAMGAATIMYLLSLI